jgi:hypothetical protein
MRLPAIFPTINDPHYAEVKKGLVERFGSLSLKHVVEGDYGYSTRYATKIYTGKLKEGVEVTELELAMLADNGYNFFGGSSVIHSNGAFYVEIWID